MQLLRQVTVNHHSSRLTQQQSASSGLRMEGCSLLHPTPTPPHPSFAGGTVTSLSSLSPFLLPSRIPLIALKARWETDSSACKCFYFSVVQEGGCWSWLLFIGIVWKKTKTYKSKLLCKNKCAKKKTCCVKSVCSTSHIPMPMVTPSSSGRR